jgi:hypothetical protein
MSGHVHKPKRSSFGGQISAGWRPVGMPPFGRDMLPGPSHTYGGLEPRTYQSFACSDIKPAWWLEAAERPHEWL